MVRVYDGETILKNMMWDVDRMIREGRKPEEVLNHISVKLEYLKNPRWERIRWWNEKAKKRSKIDEELVEEDEYEEVQY